jgi:hypothetical protein
MLPIITGHAIKLIDYPKFWQLKKKIYDKNNQNEEKTMA